MRIVPINYHNIYTKNTTSSQKPSDVSFKHLHNIPDPLFGDLFCKATANNVKDAIIKAKHSKYNFGEMLSNKLIYKFNCTNTDYTEFTKKINML